MQLLCVLGVCLSLYTSTWIQSLFNEQTYVASQFDSYVLCIWCQHNDCFVPIHVFVFNSFWNSVKQSRIVSQLKIERRANIEIRYVCDGVILPLGFTKWHHFSSLWFDCTESAAAAAVNGASLQVNNGHFVHCIRKLFNQFDSMHLKPLWTVKSRWDNQWCHQIEYHGCCFWNRTNCGSFSTQPAPLFYQFNSDGDNGMK